MVERLPGALDAMARPADDRALGRESFNEHVADGVEWRAVCSRKDELREGCRTQRLERGLRVGVGNPDSRSYRPV